MTAVQIAALIGLATSSAVVFLIRWLMPVRADLAAAVARIHTPTSDTPTIVATSRVEKLGSQAMRNLPQTMWKTVSAKDLALLQIPAYRHYGSKVVWAMIGLLVPIVIGFMCAALNMMPFYIPAAAGPILAIILWFAPDSEVKKQATGARETFKQALMAFTDMLALERISGASVREALVSVSNVSDHWVFTRIAQAVSLSTWNRQAPWHALRTLADEVQVKELAELADILSRDESGSQLATMLQSKAQSMRDEQNQSMKAAANEKGERVGLPAVVLLISYMATMATPFLTNIVSAT